MSRNKRGQVWAVRRTPDGYFVSATYECLFCGLVVHTTSATNAMMQVCDQCAQRAPTRAEVERIFSRQE